MTDVLRKFASNALMAGYGWAKNNPALRSLMYSSHNAQLFGDLRQHEWMLACDVRVDTYHDAIQKHVHEGDVVVELGTGSGVLSLFAAKKRPRCIHAIDHGGIIGLAEHLARANGVDSIRFHRCHSSEFRIDGQADVIIQEQIGDLLIDEDMVRNVCELRDRVLKPGGRILPARFELFVEPAMLDDRHGSEFIWEHTLHGVDFSAARQWIESEANTVGRVDPIVNSTRCRVARFLGEPDSVLSLDLETMQPGDLPRRIAFRRTVTRAGRLDGFCIYFDTIFDDDIHFRTGPFDPPTTWMYQVYRVDPVDCDAGDELLIEFDIADPTDIASWRITHRRVPAQQASAMLASSP